MGVGKQRHELAALRPGILRNPLYRRLGGPQGSSGRGVENLIHSRIRSSDHPAHSELIEYENICLIFFFVNLITLYQSNFSTLLIMLIFCSCNKSGYSTQSPFLSLLSRRAQSGRWSSFGKRVWFTESHIVLIIVFSLRFYLLNLFLI